MKRLEKLNSPKMRNQGMKSIRHFRQLWKKVLQVLTLRGYSKQRRLSRKTWVHIVVKIEIQISKNNLPSQEPCWKK